jgi:hypothetical protein
MDALCEQERRISPMAYGGTQLLGMTLMIKNGDRILPARPEYFIILFIPV